MSVGVQQLPATILAGTRMLIGAVVMLSFCALRGRRIFWDRRVMVRLMLLGLMLLFGGNLALVWSEQYLASGLSALIVAVVPLYIVLIEMLIPGGDRCAAGLHRPRARLRGSRRSSVAEFAKQLQRTSHAADRHCSCADRGTLLGIWISALAADEPSRGSIGSGRLGNVRRRSYEHLLRDRLLAVAARRLELAQRGRDRLPGDLRIAARLQLLHVADRTCASGRRWRPMPT